MTRFNIGSARKLHGMIIILTLMIIIPEKIVTLNGKEIF